MPIDKMSKDIRHIPILKKSKDKMPYDKMSKDKMSDEKINNI